MRQREAAAPFKPPQRPSQPAAAPLPPGPPRLAVTSDRLYIARNLSPRLSGAIAIFPLPLKRAPPASAAPLALSPLSASSGADPDVAVWVAPASGAWLPAAPGQASALPASVIACAACQARARSRSGRPFLYSVAPLPPELGMPGARLVAGSDIRAATTIAARGVAVHLVALAAAVIAELLLILAGVGFVVARPLARLNQAIDRWRSDGSFTDGPAETATEGPLEVARLADSFRQATAALDQREQDLKKATARQDILMQEIHHRVKNNLQIVASLLNLQANRIKAPEARAEFQLARDRVRALATLHRHLYATGEVHNIDMRAFFVELCAQLFQATNELDGDRITLDVRAPDVSISSDQAVPIALIVTETVGNALKYAFPGNRPGRIEVHFDVQDERHATLTVRDNGVGIEQRAEGAEGLGLQLVRGFARQLGAELSVTNDAGTCYRLAMTIERDRKNTIALGRPATSTQRSA